jgi:hypothetical protein
MKVVLRKELKCVLDELLSGVAGNNFYLRPAMEYLHPGENQSQFPFTKSICFMGLVQRCFKRGEILIGLKEEGKAAIINPKEKFVINPHIQWHR